MCVCVCVCVYAERFLLLGSITYDQSTPISSPYLYISVWQYASYRILHEDIYIKMLSICCMLIDAYCNHIHYIQFDNIETAQILLSDTRMCGIKYLMQILFSECSRRYELILV